MKRLLMLGLTVAALATTGLADRGHSRGHTHFGFYIGGPVIYGPPVYAYRDPYYYDCPPPYYYSAPGPFIGLSFGFGGGGRHFSGGRHFGGRHFR